MPKPARVGAADFITYVAHKQSPYRETDMERVVNQERQSR
jgi:hypothetical protein